MRHRLAVRSRVGIHARGAVALRAIAGFLNRVGPDGDPTHFANQLAKLAQTLQDLNEGVRAPNLRHSRGRAARAEIGGAGWPQPDPLASLVRDKPAGRL